uniref:Protein LTV1 homolog n=1 Tax=Tabanus bromius TaxID=304241 RepID=A0A0K8TRC2_TABBR
MGKAKKFIDKKNAVTFHLVNRSQRDPLITDEKAPKHVLVEAKPKQLNKDERETELKKYGIYFDDDYDYLQHLKQPGRDVVWEYVETPNKKKDEAGKPAIQLPSSVFATEFEEDEGLLNKAAPRPGPRPDWDPDVVAALDDDFDFQNPDNALEDDFIAKAMGDGEDDDEDGEEDYGSDVDSNGMMFSDDEDDDELRDRLGPLMREHRFNDEETRSRFTEYSMSSSVIRRNEQLSLLDDRFEQFYASYDDTELGARDLEDIEGYIDQTNPAVMECYRLYKKEDKEIDYDKNWDAERIKRLQEEGSGEEELVEMEVKDEKEKWDCESILSTYSNIYNHPKLIEEPKRNKKIQIDPKTGLPSNVFRSGEDKLTAKSLAKFDTENQPNQSSEGPKSLCAKSVLSTLSVLSIRPKDESPEEKRERKRLLKEYRAERRMERKANAEAFKEEKKRQEKIKINNQNNIQGNKIL